ncbi:MAG: hypothetical protein P8X50_11605 [Maritimibacter sp.]
MLPRKKLSELKARFRLEPTLDDVFVEGDRDKKLLDQAHKHKERNRPTYSISTIEIPAKLLADLGFTDGNRQRVLALCRTLGLPSECGVHFLIDADMDRQLNREISMPRLSYTCYTDVDGVFFSSSMLENLVINAGRASVDDWPTLFRSIEDVVRKIFCVRLAVEELALGVGLPSISKSLSKTKTELRFDLDAFVSKLSTQSVDPQGIQEVKDRAAKWDEKTSGVEARMAGRGHDYFEVLAWVIKKFGGKTGVADALEDIVVLLVPSVANDLLAPLG